MSALLEVTGIRLAHGDLTAVWDVSLQASAGRTTALVGRNGAGKTTLMSGIMGLLDARAGQVLLDGEDITKLSTHRRVGRGLSLVQEGKRVLRGLSVRENLLLGGFARHPSPRDLEDLLDEMYERFPALAGRGEVMAGALSGGQQQMLAIAQGLVTRPKVLLIDEPSSGLAPVIVDEVLEIVDGLKREGLAIVLVEQLLEEVLDGLADDIVMLDHGRVVLAAAAADVSMDELAAHIHLGAP